DQGYISEARAGAAEREPLRIAENEWRPSISAEPSALDAVRALVDSVMPDVLKEGDVNVYTTVDATLQRSADRTMIKHLAEVTEETRETMGRVSDEAQGALVALDPFTGDIRARHSSRSSTRRRSRPATSPRRRSTTIPSRSTSGGPCGPGQLQRRVQ